MAPWLSMPTMHTSGRRSCDSTRSSHHDAFSCFRRESRNPSMASANGRHISASTQVAVGSCPALEVQQTVERSARQGCVIRARTTRCGNQSSSNDSRSSNRLSNRGRIFAWAARPAWLVLTLLALVLVATPAAAVQFEFDNCLPDSYRLHKPPLLQWEPLYVDAVFDTKTPNHNLQVIVWGNVTGSQNLSPLPPPNDPYWTNPDDTNGKIEQTPYSDTLATTLVSRVNVLTYEPWNDRSDFCAASLVNGTCPLAPTFGNVDLPYGLPSVNLSHDFFSSYAFSSFAVTFLVINGDPAATNIGCVSATITPDLGSISWVLKFMPLLVLLFAGFAVPFAGIWSPWGTTNVFHWTANYGRDADLLRLVTPGFSDCLQYIQFIVLTGALTLDYPGYFQPVVSQVGWSSLMFNESFVAHADPWQNVEDGIYVTKAGTVYGLQKMAQLIGMSEAEDVWPGMMVWLCVIIASVIVLIQLGFALQWILRKIRRTTEEDLRAKNIPFVIGNVVRIVFNFMLIPIVALSCFQFVVSGQSPGWTVALAALTLAVVIGFAAYLLWLIIITRPKSVLFDDLPTVLRYGPLYNTYADEVAAFALIPILLNVIRGVAIGAVQPSGVAQVVLLAICEVIQIIMIYAFRPYQKATSMNIYHSLFAGLRLIIIILMVTFVPSLGVTEGPKGWIGYAILLLHACVLALGFFLGAVQTIIEVIARLFGAGGDDVTGLTRGGLSKIFGMRQLSRRVNHRQGPSRASQLSTAAMLDAEDSGKSGFVMPSGRVRSGSVASLSGVMAHHRHRSSSALDSMYSAAQRNVDTASSYVPGTPGEASTFSFLASPSAARQGPPGVVVEASDPYYRPPRRRREMTGDSSQLESRRDSLTIEPVAQAGGLAPEAPDSGAEISRGATPAPGHGGNNLSISFPANRPDYSTREVDFYYGVRGPALNSEGPGRKLGTGPADPTGPAATAAGWLRSLLFGGKTKDKGKGFEVVRSARMPPNMVRNGGFGDETPPEGIPVAMGVVRNGPIDSDDDDEPQVRRPKRREGELLDNNGDPQSESDNGEPDSPVTDRLPRGRMSQSAVALSSKKAEASHDGVDIEGVSDEDMSDPDHDAPVIPRKSSKRHSAVLDRTPQITPLVRIDSHTRRPDSRASQQTAQTESTLQQGGVSLLPRLPFERTGSDRRSDQRPSSKSSLDFPDLRSIDSATQDDPAGFGTVSHHSISRIDPQTVDDDMLSTAASVVDDAHSAKDV
ncbi:hypothetical protein M440DRAFT_1420269 [Trichoderma longibrachiatum ATCC 18648]|uniref:ML-like domain-containing protein n=1 Tax=Trichoderma longibrachiatum ATCC 18648 TaxID=983965 RepID=A0A2T4C963_TRILO|nr:hypothetical protein M440DRAFT_1420269 [Trichoderma longibrachiatum ATCC 18648]